MVSKHGFIVSKINMEASPIMRIFNWYLEHRFTVVGLIWRHLLKKTIFGTSFIYLLLFLIRFHYLNTFHFIPLFFVLLWFNHSIFTHFKTPKKNVNGFLWICDASVASWNLATKQRHHLCPVFVCITRKLNQLKSCHIFIFIKRLPWKFHRP